MTSLYADSYTDSGQNPLDMIEGLLGTNEWPFERVTDDEITASVSGKWCEYHMRFFWREDGRVLQTACVFDARIPAPRRAKIFETLALINERMWVGHFEIWTDENVLMYRHATIAEADTFGISSQVCETLIETALSECERFFPVFQFVIWAGKEPAEAIEAALLETVGEA